MVKSTRWMFLIAVLVISSMLLSACGGDNATATTGTGTTGGGAAAATDTPAAAGAETEREDERRQRRPDAPYQCTPFIRLAIAICSIEAFSSGSFLPLDAAESGNTR